MSITDELREYAQSWRETPSLMDDLDAGDIDGLLGDLEHIADLIDAEHERGMADAELAAVPAEAQLDELGWVRGPLDANGEMWHCGDMSDSNWGVIEGIAYENGRWLISGHDTSAPWIPADSINHYHEPTVEDVLREFAEKVIDSQIPGVHPTYEKAIAEYAAKLRLADDGKEK